VLLLQTSDSETTDRFIMKVMPFDPILSHVFTLLLTGTTIWRTAYLRFGTTVMALTQHSAQNEVR